jgi:type IV pilus assembly protein PilO
MSVLGRYEELATFASAVSSLPRIVTLHDFELKSDGASGSSRLRLNILAKTYRYNDKAGGVKK